MTLIELTAFLGGVAGLVAGGVAGYRFGFVGSVAGALLGFVAGLVGGTALLGGGWMVGIWLERGKRRRALAHYFGRYWDKARASAWAQLKESVRGGQRVRGVVKHTFYYGAFVDLGCGFPALLQTVDGPKGVHPLPSVGEFVEAIVSDFDDEGFELTVSRYTGTWVVFDGVPVARVPGGWPGPERPRVAAYSVRNQALARLVEKLERRESVECELVEDQQRRPGIVVGVKRARLDIEFPSPGLAQATRSGAG